MEKGKSAQAARGKWPFNQWNDEDESPGPEAQHGADEKCFSEDGERVGDGAGYRLLVLLLLLWFASLCYK